MPLIYLIRHAEPEKDGGGDFGLTARGHEQARVTAAALAQRWPAPLPLLSSPLLRCRDTAAPLARRWGVELRIEPRVIEFPSPQAQGVVRGDWLRFALRGSWQAAADDGEARQPGYAAQLADWRAGIVAALRDCTQDTVICTHFVVINSLLGGLRGDGGAICQAMPDHASVSVVECVDGRLALLEMGREIVTPVL
ncbi:MAG: histidine phosphatase family protein [Solimonas sp.]